MCFVFFHSTAAWVLVQIEEEGETWFILQVDASVQELGLVDLRSECSVLKDQIYSTLELDSDHLYSINLVPSSHVILRSYLPACSCTICKG